jgi:hypothetical protein
MTLQWYTLVKGFPSMPVNSDSADAETFLRTLFQRVCRVNVGACEVEREAQDATTRIVEGYCGTREIGFRWTRQIQVADSATDHMLITTFGLPRMELRWAYLLCKSGYDYRFSHLWLQVGFANDLVQAQFNQCWVDIFAVQPHFQAKIVEGDG